jgi:hypothetical protein
MESTERYRCPGSYGYSKLVKLKVLEPTKNNNTFRCYLVFYSHVGVEANPYSEIHSASFDCLIYKANNTTTSAWYNFDTEEEARQYFETTTVDNVEERYAKPLLED